MKRKKFFLLLLVVLFNCFVRADGLPSLPTTYFSEDFESYTGASTYKATAQATGWTSTSLSTATTYLPFIMDYSAQAHSGTKSYSVTGAKNRTFPGTSINGPSWVATPELTVTNWSGVDVNFAIKGTANQYWLFGVMTDPADLSTFTPILDSIKGTGSYVEYTLHMADYTDKIGSAKYLAWRTGINADGSFYLDDVTVVEHTCDVPSITAAPTHESAVLTNASTDNLAWRLIVSSSAMSTTDLANGILPTGILTDTEIEAGTNSYTVTGLEPSATYYYAAQHYCTALKLSFWTTGSFTTYCAPAVPEELGTISFETSEGYTVGQNAAMSCWNRGITASTTSYQGMKPHVETYNEAASILAHAHTGDNFLYFYAARNQADNGYAIMPNMAIENINEYQVSFWGQAVIIDDMMQRDGSVIVGLTSKLDDISTFEAVDTIVSDGTEMTQYTVSFKNYTGTGKYIAFMCSQDGRSTNIFAVDDITVGLIPVINASDTTICEGSYVEFRDRKLTEAGIYSDTLKTASGKDSILVMTVHVNKPSAYTLKETICHGGVYHFQGMELREAGIYCDTLVNSVNCDSILTLELTMSDMDTVLMDTAIVLSSLPYVYESITYPQGTAVGLYTDTITVSGNDDCDYILIHHLSISDPSATALEQLFNTMDGKTQKIIYRNQLYIIRKGEVYDATGRKVVLM